MDKNEKKEYYRLRQKKYIEKYSIDIICDICGKKIKQYYLNNHKKKNKNCKKIYNDSNYRKLLDRIIAIEEIIKKPFL